MEGSTDLLISSRWRKRECLRLCSCNCREQPEVLSHMDTKIYYKMEKA